MRPSASGRSAVGVLCFWLALNTSIPFLLPCAPANLAVCVPNCYACTKNVCRPNPDGPENKCRDNVVHRPKVQARTMWDDQYLAVQFRVEDKYVRCKGTEFQDMVCRDSCCEFFVAPFAQSDDDTAFFNFEVNAAATMLLYKCKGGGCRDTTKVTLEDAASIMMASSLTGKKTAADTGMRVPADGWEEDRKLPASDPRLVAPEIQADTTFCIEYHVPWELFAKWHGVQRPTGGAQWRCNFCESFC